MKIRYTRAIVLTLATVAVSVGLVSCGAIDESLFPLGSRLPKFLFTINDADVSAFTVNAQTGAVTPTPGSPFSQGFTTPPPPNFCQGPAPDLAAANPRGTLLFVPEACSNSIVVFNIDQSSGALSPVAGSPFATGTTNFDLQQPVVDPTGRFLYVPQDFLSGPVQGQVLGFKIGDNGSLTAIPGSPFPAGGSDEGLVIDPQGKFLYVADTLNPGTITAFSIDPNSGALTAITGSPFMLPDQPKFIAMAPSGKFLYATAPDKGNILVLAVDPNTGALTVGPNTRVVVDALNPQALDISPSGKFLFVTDLGDPEPATPVTGKILAFAIDAATGAPTPVPGSPFTAGPNPKRIAADPSGKFVYVTNEDSDNMSAFSVDQSTGALTQIAGSPFATSRGAEGVTITHR
jgi:6-phosphogluconolactonase